MEKKTKSTGKQKAEGLEDYPGVAINEADKDKENPCLVKERTKTLNNNPRNDD